jgi:bacteriocin biosynthesis cyclodehydratase domain-containing protein
VSVRGNPDGGTADRAGVGRSQGQLVPHTGAPLSGGAPAPQAVPRYRLHGALEMFAARDGDVYLLRGGSGPEHIIKSPGPTDRALLRELATNGLPIAAGSDARRRVGPLIAAGAVVREPDVRTLPGTDAARFVRQLPYFEDFGDPVAAQRRLRDSTVAVLGCGGLGTWALAALACAGVGRFVLIDDDIVELSNLNRQVLYGVKDVGSAKVACVAQWLAGFDPSITIDAQPRRIRGSGDLGALGHCNALLLCADWPPYELARWVNQASLALQLPFVMAGQQPPVVKIGPTFRPGHGACFGCHETRLRREFACYDELAEARIAAPPAATTLGPASALIGSILALEVLHLLLGVWPVATHDRVFLLDIRTLELRSEAVVPDADCSACRTLGADEFDG